MFAERRAKLFEFFVESFQRSKLIQNLAKLVLENVHRLEHVGQSDHPISNSRNGSNTFARSHSRCIGSRNDAMRAELCLQRLDLIKNRSYHQPGLKTGILVPV